MGEAMTDNGLAALAAALDPHICGPVVHVCRDVAAAILGERGVFLPDPSKWLVQMGEYEATMTTLRAALDGLVEAMGGFLWLGNNLDNITLAPLRFHEMYEAAMDDARAALATAKEADHAAS
jgi:hypothetical protein